MPTSGDVLSWRGTGLREAGQALAEAARKYQEVSTSLSQLRADGLEGETAEAEARARRILADDAEDIQTRLESCGSDLEASADSVDAAQDAAADLKTRASGNEFSIDSSGSAHNELPVTPATQAQRQADAKKYESQVRTLVEQAEDVVAYIEGVLDDLAQLSSTAKGPSAEVVDHGPHQPPESWGPEAVNDWWTSLSPAEQQHIINTHPSWIGNLDGIPCDDRHKANRIWLNKKYEEVESELAAAPSTVWVQAGYGGYYQRNPEIDRLKALKAELELLRTQLSDKDLREEHTLLVFNPVGDHVRAAIGTGNVDKADHVVVNTPGMNTNITGDIVRTDEKWGSKVGDTDRIVEEARRQLEMATPKDETAESVAGVTWLDYDAPGSEDTLNPRRSVLSDTKAQQAAPDLASFYDGLQATHHGDPHLTAAGHSYGSVVTGLAVQQSSAPDDLLAYGSPGLKNDNAADMGLPPDGHMFSASTDNDITASSGWHDDHVPAAGGNINGSEGITHLETDAHSNPGYKSDDPTTGDKELPGSSGHSEYTLREDEGERRTPSTSLYNLGSVVAGNGKVIPEGG